MPIGVYVRTKKQLKKMREVSLKNGSKPPSRKGETMEGTKLWKGENVQYNALHAWVRNKKGKAFHCSHCKKTDKKKYEWANKDHKYRRQLEDYFSLCISCHRKYDYENHLSNIGSKYGSIKNKL